MVLAVTIIIPPQYRISGRVFDYSNFNFSEINERPASGTKLFITLFLEIGNDARTTEFAGCMSFGARKIIQEKSIFKVSSSLNSPF